MPSFTTLNLWLVFVGMKAIKLHAWEAPFEKRINDLREVEMQQIRQALSAMRCYVVRHEAGTTS